MQTVFYLNGVKITYKAMAELIGADQVERHLKTAKMFLEDNPQMDLTEYWTAKGLLTILFK